MPLEIKVVQSRKDFFDFLNLPQSIYLDDQYSPPALPLETLQRVPHQLFLALERGQPVGRIAALLEPRSKEPDTGFFGALETIRQPAVAAALIQNAAAWLAAQKRKRMIGPATFNTNQQVGLLIAGFDEPPAPGIPYNPPYYQELMEGCGFQKLTDLLSFSWSLNQAIPPPLDRIASRAAQRKGLVLRPVNPFNFSQDVQIITHILNQGMARNWGYLPLTFGETHSLVNYCLAKGDPSLALIITIKKQPAAFSLCLPADRRYPFPRMAFLAVVPEFRALGYETLLFKRTLEILQRRNYLKLEASQIDENNSAMIKIIQKFSFLPIKRHRVYEKKITP